MMKEQLQQQLQQLNGMREVVGEQKHRSMCFKILFKHFINVFNEKKEDGKLTIGNLAFVINLQLKSMNIREVSYSYVYKEVAGE